MGFLIRAFGAGKKEERLDASHSSLTRRSVQKFFSRKLSMLGLCIVLFFILAAIFAPVISIYDPMQIDPTLKFAPPSSEHLLGTDGVGRDLLTRLFYGGRISILIGIMGAACATTIGSALGCVAGYFGGPVNRIILYVNEIVSSFPYMILVIIMMAFSKGGLQSLIFIFAVTGWTGSMRIVRGKILSLREETFVESCRANGIGNLSIMFRHLIPNTFGPIIVDFTLGTGLYVLAEAAISFLGIGLDPSIPTWGNMINAARTLNIIQNYPNVWLAPGIVISLFTLGINFFGDGLRDALDSKD